MNKYLYVETKTVYGNELVYPKCERSQVLAKLCGTKTFTEKHMNLIKKLGYEFTTDEIEKVVNLARKRKVGTRPKKLRRLKNVK